MLLQRMCLPHKECMLLLQSLLHMFQQHMKYKL
jgi:hypothetical protein